MVELHTSIQSFFKGDNQFIRSSVSIENSRGLLFIDNSTFTGGGYPGKVLFEFTGEDLRLNNCTFENNALDQNVVASISASTVGVTGSTFINNTVKAFGDAAPIAILGRPLLALADENLFSCNGIRHPDGRLTYPYPIHLDVAHTPNIYARGNIVANCSISETVTPPTMFKFIFKQNLPSTKDKTLHLEVYTTRIFSSWSCDLLWSVFCWQILFC